VRFSELDLLRLTVGSQGEGQDILPSFLSEVGIWLSDSERAKGILETGGELPAAGISGLWEGKPEPAWAPLNRVD
jgi:hypothetical protein